MSDQFITFDGDVWLVAGRGVTNEAGEIFCHLSSTTRFRQQRNGKCPVQICTFVPANALKGEAAAPASGARRLGKSPHTGRPIIQEWNDVYSYWATVAFADGESL